MLISERHVPRALRSLHPPPPPPIVSSHLTDGEKEYTSHCFSPLCRWGERVNYTPSVRWKFENVSHTHSSHHNKMEKKSVPPTLFPHLRGRKRSKSEKFYGTMRTISNIFAPQAIFQHDSTSSAVWLKTARRDAWEE